MADEEKKIIENEELSEDELDAVSGGGACQCTLVGGGTKGWYTDEDGDKAISKACACVGGGGGQYVEDGETYCRCACVVQGFGESGKSCDGGNGSDEAWD